MVVNNTSLFNVTTALLSPLNKQMSSNNVKTSLEELRYITIRWLDD